LVKTLPVAVAVVKIDITGDLGCGNSYEQITTIARGGASPPSWGGQIEKKKFWGAKIRKNNKFWGKILIFFLNFLIFLIFFWENLWAWGGPGPPKPQGGSAPDYRYCNRLYTPTLHLCSFGSL
jgi:hypothetical protein